MAQIPANTDCLKNTNSSEIIVYAQDHETVSANDVINRLEKLIDKLDNAADENGDIDIEELPMNLRLKLQLISEDVTCGLISEDVTCGVDGKNDDSELDIVAEDGV